ncbi:hypothetical protein M422DRAFT_40790 [Sphaerobolus stellatus SS14]|nr:hypothetical protein M422DRAFT_40790 [Sphaerobolus stellatus SS14]
MPHRSESGHHDLLPSSSRGVSVLVPSVPLSERSIAKVTGGVVIWRIWPAVFLHTAFAAVITVLQISDRSPIKLAIPNVLLTLLGVVIGFVISLRVSSGYDRYWWGRCAWSDLMKNSRTMSRLIWIHLPPKITKSDGDTPPSRQDIGQAMREKRVALELIEAFSVSVKHYLRGELGIYYEDLYHVARPFHEHHGQAHAETEHELARRPSRQYSIESYSQLPADERPQLKRSASKSSSRQTNVSPSQTPGTTTPSAGPSATLHPSSQSDNPVVPIITSYGSVNAEHVLRHQSSRTSLTSSHSGEDERDPLLPARLPLTSGARIDLIPFLSWGVKIGRAINPYYWYKGWRAHWREGFEGNDEAGGVNIRWANDVNGAEQGRPRGIFKRLRRHAARQTHTSGGKHRPRVAGDGENLPLEILRCLSEWISVLDARGTAPGGALGGLYGCISQFEDTLAGLERVLTTPLPYVYSAHIRHTVWLYLFFMPFQLAESFRWYTIPGTCVAAFFYLGFIAAGDEIEQPFGYDENDLDLDLFCRDIIRADLHTLIVTPFPNAPVGSHGLDVNDASTIVDISLGKHRVHDQQ